MAKYQPTDIPEGETKRICDMTAVEYRSWLGRCGGRSKSPRKLRAQRRNGSKPKPALARYYAVVKKVAGWSSIDAPYARRGRVVDEIVALSTPEYVIDMARALKILEAAQNYRERNPL